MRAFLLMAMATAGLLVARPAHAADWVEVKTKHFTLYGKKSDRDLPQLATRLELLNKLLATVLKMPEDGGEGERPLIVYVVSGSEVTENAPTKTAAGFYATDKRNGYAVVKRGKTTGAFDLGQEPILFHEFAHHFMMARSSAVYPAWYVEGFAEFFATLEFKDDKKILFGNPPMYRVPQLVTADLYPIHKLLHESATGLSLGEGDRYYGAAWLLTHYVFLNPERGKEFQAYITDLSSPGGAKDVETYFKGGEKALTKELNVYVRSRLKGYGISLSQNDVPAPEVRPLKPDENAMLIEELRFKRHMDHEDATALAREVQAIAARFPDSAYAQAFAAEVLTDLKDWKPATVAADAAIRIDPKNARAHAAKAEILWGEANEAGEATPYKAILLEIAAANRADLDDPYPLFLYYMLKRKQGPLPPVAMDGLQKAFQQLPQYSTYRWAYADALAGQKDYGHAIDVITPLANDPHGDKGAVFAQKKRDQFIALRDGKPLPVFDDKDDAPPAGVPGAKAK